MFITRGWLGSTARGYGCKRQPAAAAAAPSQWQAFGKAADYWEQVEIEPVSLGWFICGDG